MKKANQPKIFNFKNRFSKARIGLVFLGILIFLTGYFLGFRAPGSYYYTDALRPLSQALEDIDREYPYKYNQEDLVESALAGLVAGLNDPYSAYIWAKDLDSFFEDLEGEFEGIGIEISVRGGEYIVVAPLEGYPAQKAGVKSGDKILEVDSQKIEELTLDEVVAMIRGKKGTKITLGIFRTRSKENLEFEIERAVIKITSLSLRFIDNVAIIRVIQFDNNTYSLLQDAIEKIKEKKTKKIVLDLRNNPGGYLDQSISFSEEFLKKGQVVLYEKTKRKTTPVRSSKNGELKDLEVVVLINEGSASASEIVAAALRDNNKATLVGIKSFGKGTVQDINQLSIGGAIKLTTALWLTPKKKNLEENGVVPDIKVQFTEEQQFLGEDPQLDKALEVLK